MYIPIIAHINETWEEWPFPITPTPIKSRKYGGGGLKPSFGYNTNKNEHELCIFWLQPLLFNTANELICQAADRVFEVTRGKRAYKSSGPKWYDAECRNIRSSAVKAGERVHSQADMDNLSEKCRQYRAYKQMKKRTFRNETINAIEDACIRNSLNFWNIIDRVCPQPVSLNGPRGQEFIDYLKELSVPQHRDYFDNSLENEAKSFLNRHGPVIDNTYNRASYLENKIINDYFTVTEIENAIDCLKCDKAPGVDYIPAEFIKHCKSILSDTITEVFDYKVEKRDFPECCAEGLRSAIYKSGRYEVPENYRGITILPVLEKVFEIAVYKWIRHSAKKTNTTVVSWKEGGQLITYSLLMGSLKDRCYLTGISSYVL